MGSGRRGGGVWASGDRLKISCYESRSLFLPPEASRRRKGSKHNSRTCAPSGQGRSLIGEGGEAPILCCVLSGSGGWEFLLSFLFLFFFIFWMVDEVRCNNFFKEIFHSLNLRVMLLILKIFLIIKYVRIFFFFTIRVIFWYGIIILSQFFRQFVLKKFVCRWKYVMTIILIHRGKRIMIRILFKCVSYWIFLMTW